MNKHENYISNAKRQGAEYVPAFVHINDSSWDEYREEMEEVALKYPEYFPFVKKGWRDYANYKFPNNRNKDIVFIDNWGCEKRTTMNGIAGTTTKHILTDYSKLSSLIIPDPNILFDEIKANYEDVQKSIEIAKLNGDIRTAGLEHGHLFLRLLDLRGYDDIIFDMFDDEPKLFDLIEIIENVMLERIQHFLKMDIGVFWLAEDLGMQTSPMLSVDMFEKYIKPSYKRLIDPIKKRDVLCGLHSDGHIMDLMPSLIDCNIDIINLQDIVNGIDNIKRELKGKASIRLDIDRQNILPFGTPKDVDDLIKQEITELGSKEGGLEMIAGIYPPVKPQNVDALCNALRKYRTMHF